MKKDEENNLEEFGTAKILGPFTNSGSSTVESEPSVFSSAPLLELKPEEPFFNDSTQSAIRNSQSPIDLGLPHRAPFLFIDKVLSVSSDEALAEKTFAAEDPIFSGHFPENPIVPGVLLTEALAQAAGLAAGWNGKGDGFLLTAIRSMKFFRAIRPGERIELHAKRAAVLGLLYQFEVTANVDNGVVAEGVIVLSRACPSSD